MNPTLRTPLDTPVRRQQTLARRAITIALAAAIAGGAYAWGRTHFPDAHAATLPALAAGTTAVPAAAVQGLPDFSALVAQNGPAVVNISVTQSAKAAAVPFQGMDPNDPFFEFFRRFMPPGTPQGGQAAPAHAVGSGFIVSNDGYILTNAHVVRDATDVTVRLTDRRQFKAKVIGVDPRTDVAVIRIDARNLPTVRLGNPDEMKPGEWVVAIGSPFGFENSVTAGVVSAKGRALPDENYVPFIQTDVAVNPGNSGGPLFNLRGEVVGINSQIYSQTGGYMGLSFAIPIDVAVKVKDQVLAHGYVSRGKLGVAVQEVSEDLAQSFGLKQAGGALVSSVEKGGPADKAGLRAGDILVRVDGKEITRAGELSLAVGNAKPGATVLLEVWRDGARQTLAATVGEQRDRTVAEAPAAPAQGARLGVAVRPLTPEERRQAELGGGLLVEQSGGPAAGAGIQPGDIILSVNGKPVNSVDELRRLLKDAGTRIAVLVQRQDARLFVPVNLG